MLMNSLVEGYMILIKSEKEKEIALKKMYHHKEFRAFAYLPVKLTNGSVVWLQHYNKYTYVVHGIVQTIRF